MLSRLRERESEREGGREGVREGDREEGRDGWKERESGARKRFQNGPNCFRIFIRNNKSFKAMLCHLECRSLDKEGCWV